MRRDIVVCLYVRTGMYVLQHHVCCIRISVCHFYGCGALHASDRLTKSKDILTAMLVMQSLLISEDYVHD